MKKNKGIVIASVVAVALVGSIALGLSFRNNTVNAGANKENQIEGLTEEMKDKFDEVNSLILLGDEKVENKDYTGALTDYDNALEVLENFVQEKELPVAQLGELALPLKRGIITKIENVKSIIEKAEKETEVYTFENAKQEDVDNAIDDKNMNNGNSSDTNNYNNSSTAEKQTELTTQAITTIKEQSTQATTQKPVETTTVKKEPVTETTDKVQSNNNTSTKQPSNNIPKGESLDDLLKESGWTDEDIANSGGGTGEAFGTYEADAPEWNNIIGQ